MAVKRRAGDEKRSVPGFTPAQQEHIVQTLQRLRNSSDYPTTLGRLLAAANVPVSQAAAVSTSTKLRPQLSLTAKSTARGDALASALVCLAADTAHMARSDHVLVHLIESRAQGAAKAHSVAELGSQLPEKLQGPFKKHWKAAAPEGRLPPGIAAIVASRTLLLFREGDLLTRKRHSPTPAAGPKAVPAQPPALAPRGPDPVPSDEQKPIADHILRAFATIDARLGGQNYVPLLELRTALPDVGRVEFDQAIAALRWERRLSLDAADGRHQRVDAAELEAGIVEEGQTLIYAQRRHP